MDPSKPSVPLDHSVRHQLPMFDLNATTHERMSALERFIEYWAGPRRPEYGESKEALARTQLPDPLRRLYQFASKWPPMRSPVTLSNPHLFSSQDQLLPLAELRTTADGKLLFAQENQNCWQCITEAEGEDPPVWSYRGDEAPELVCDHLSGFLVSLCLQELLFGSRFSIAHSPADDSSLAPPPSWMQNAVPLWKGHPFVIGNRHDFFLAAPGLLIADMDVVAFAAAQTDAGELRLLQLDTQLDHVFIHPPFSRVNAWWMLKVRIDGSGELSLSNRDSTGAFPPRTIDFATLRDQLFLARNLSLNHLETWSAYFASDHPRPTPMPLADTGMLRPAFEKALSALCTRSSRLDILLHTHPPLAAFLP